MKNHLKICLVTILLFMASSLMAQEDGMATFNPVEHAVISLTIAPDARSAGMGDVGVATEPDVYSQYWNPAKYPFCISRAGVGISYTPWLRKLVGDIYLANVSGYYRIGDYSAVSASLRYFSLGEVFTSDGEDMTVKPYEMAIDAAYSLMLSEKFSLAAAIRWIYSDLRYDYREDSKPASAFAADLALYYNTFFNWGPRECQLALGMNISNIGSKITFYGDEESQFLPANLRIGASLAIPIDEYNKITFAADANKLLVPTVPTKQQYIDDELGGDESLYAEGLYRDYVRRKYSDVGSIAGIFKSFGDAPGGFSEELSEIQWSIGAEYVYHDRFMLRAGYHHEAQSKGNRKYFTVGGGFHLSAFTLDVGYVISTAQSNPLDRTLRFSLTFDIDGIKDLFKRK